MHKISLIAIVTVFAALGWAAGTWYTQENQRSQLAILCQKIARIKIFDAGSGLEIQSQPITCKAKPNGYACEHVSRQISEAIGSSKIKKILPNVLYIDPYKYGMQIGLNRQEYILSDGKILSITDVSSRSSVSRNLPWSLFYDDQAPKSCSDMRI